MIAEILIKKQLLHFHASFCIAYEEVTEAEIIIIQITDIYGHIAFGSASPDTEVTGETLGNVFKILKEKLNKEFFEYDLKSWYKYHEKIQQVFVGFPSAQAAVEETFFNLWSQIHKIPLSSFLGGYRESCHTMITIGIKSPEATILEVKKKTCGGIPNHKNKMWTQCRRGPNKNKTSTKTHPL